MYPCCPEPFYSSVLPLIPCVPARTARLRRHCRESSPPVPCSYSCQCPLLFCFQLFNLWPFTDTCKARYHPEAHCHQTADGGRGGRAAALNQLKLKEVVITAAHRVAALRWDSVGVSQCIPRMAALSDAHAGPALPVQQALCSGGARGGPTPPARPGRGAPSRAAPLAGWRGACKASK